MSCEITLRLPQRKSAYEEAVHDILEDQDNVTLTDRERDLMREILEALRLS